MNENVDPARVESEQKALPAPKIAPALPAPAPSRPPKSRRLVKWLFVLAFAVACLFVWQYFERTETSTEPTAGKGRGGTPAQTIRDAATTTGDIALTVSALGTVTPLANVTVRTQIAGTLQQVGFVEGQMVKAGDFLAQIDPRPYQATLDQAEGQLAKDTALHAQAQANLARFQTLGRQDSIAGQQIDDQKFLVAQDAAAMQTDQAQIDAAKLNIAYCHIVAPVSGRVGLRQVDPGNYVQVTDANGIVVITQIQPISVIFSVPEDNLPQIQARLNAGAVLPATAFDRANVKQLATGMLTTFDNQIDTTTGTFKLRATFGNEDGALFPNQFVNLTLLVDTLKGAVLAPNAAVQLGPNGNFVYLVKDDETVTVRNIKIGPADASNTSIVSGLAAGDHVVIDGADRLRDGAKISVRNGAAPTAAPAGTNAPATAPDGPKVTPDQNQNGQSEPPADNAQPGQAGQHRHRRDKQDPSEPAPASPPT